MHIIYNVKYFFMGTSVYFALANVFYKALDVSFEQICNRAGKKTNPLNSYSERPGICSVCSMHIALPDTPSIQTNHHLGRSQYNNYVPQFFLFLNPLRFSTIVYTYSRPCMEVAQCFQIPRNEKAFVVTDKYLF